jgi:hypothetical protein
MIINEVVEIEKSEYIKDTQNPSVSMTINGISINGYSLSNINSFAPNGYISKPVQYTTAMAIFDPHRTSAVVLGFDNAVPEDNQTIGELLDGEVVISETDKYNYNLQLKLNGVFSKFLNSNDELINTNLPITENFITCIKDMMAEILAYETYNNAQISTLNNNINTLNTLITKLAIAASNFALHTHISNAPTLPTSTPSNAMDMVSSALTTLQNYNITSQFTRDKNIVDNNPTQLQICPDGEIIS